MANYDNNIGFAGQNINDNHNQHEGNGRSLRYYLKLDRMIQLSCIIFPLNITHFEIK